MAQELERQLTRARSLRIYLLERIHKQAESLALDLKRVAQAETADAVINISVSAEEWTRLLVDRARLEELQERIVTLEYLLDESLGNPIRPSKIG